MTQLLAVITITLLAIISPGPDFAMVTRNSVLLSRRAGVFTALGISLAVLVHVTYTLVGLGLLLQQSQWLFSGLKLVGAIYLVWLGVKMLRASPDDAAGDGSVAPLSDLAALRTGFLTNVLNPKTTIFIVSLFMQVLQPGTPLAVQIAYGGFCGGAHGLVRVNGNVFFGNRLTGPVAGCTPLDRSGFWRVAGGVWGVAGASTLSRRCTSVCYKQ